MAYGTDPINTCQGTNTEIVILSGIFERACIFIQINGQRIGLCRIYIDSRAEVLHICPTAQSKTDTVGYPLIRESK